MNHVTVTDTLPDGLLFIDTLSIGNDTEILGSMSHELQNTLKCHSWDG
jgi:conserved repeat domain